ncbi:hypothetical protein GZ77_25385 [Endozoicomonas montiporae]|uniref:Uncharacterized protein n=2 Tax=Endozoicomonas montiporae TaxID=1027273 RepID=A0A081MZ16_9GAMM|nr:hypothetical protein [Endozoicomonas montiporae]AMO54911.1 hypothetical protein EZMO1_0672 [Endozoicomonas montiporae CL-33]KEQ11439.1 hypothetical protein GZ77_25385 [Endozoicomonas montiporae]
MMRPFNPNIVNKFIGEGQSPDRILRFSDQKQVDSEKKGVLWQSKEAKRLGKALQLFVSRHLELAVKTINKRAIKVVNREQCKNLINHYRNQPVSEIHQLEITLLEAVVSQNQEGVNKALDEMKDLFKLSFGDEWPEKYQAFLKDESKEILKLSQAHSDQGFISRLMFGKPKYKTMIEALDKKIDKQKGELNRARQKQDIQKWQGNQRKRKSGKPVQNRDQARAAKRNRQQNTSGNIPARRTQNQQVPIDSKAAQQLAFDIVCEQAKEIKAEDYQLAMEYDLLNSHMVEALLREGDVSHAAETFKELVKALRPEKKVASQPPQRSQRQNVAGNRTERAEAQQARQLPNDLQVAQKLAFDIARGHTEEIRAEDFQLAIKHGLLNGVSAQKSVHEAKLQFVV